MLVKNPLRNQRGVALTVVDAGVTGLHDPVCWGFLRV